MATYAVAIMHETRMGPAIRQYLQQIDATLRPYSGQFRIHGGPYHEVEGSWTGDLVVIEFPDMDKARQWYQSSAYQAIQPLRAKNSSGGIIFVDGVEENHKATELLELE